jgi:C4-dicarboxylate transporter
MDLLIELSCDSALKEHFDKLSLINFWLSCQNEYSQLSQIAVRFLIPFVKTYEGESTENRKTEIKIRNIAPLSYRLADMLPML